MKIGDKVWYLHMDIKNCYLTVEESEITGEDVRNRYMVTYIDKNDNSKTIEYWIYYKDLFSSEANALAHLKLLMDIVASGLKKKVESLNIKSKVNDKIWFIFLCEYSSMMDILEGEVKEIDYTDSTIEVGYIEDGIPHLTWIKKDFVFTSLLDAVKHFKTLTDKVYSKLSVKAQDYNEATNNTNQITPNQI